jgi:ATP-dependent helicase Lhr and Lhr-like helicase
MAPGFSASGLSRQGGCVTSSATTSPVHGWFLQRFGQPTPAQAAAWPHIRAGRNALIVSPTGTGKTLAAFLAILDQLAAEDAAGRLTEAIHAVYISPLRALGYDLGKNLRRPLQEIYGDQPPITVGLRSGDTPAEERERQFKHPPHILLTTPESLALLLSQTRWLDHLATVRWLIVDEIHALAENKRGAHLSLSIERLEHLRASTGHPPLQRIGLSATVHPLPDVAAFLVGTGRPCEIIDVSTAKRIDLRVHTPLERNPYPSAGFTGVRLMRELAALIRRHRTTLVFTNTRSGAEAATYWLRENLAELAEQVECHHASLDRDLRLDVEDRLKRGELRAVVCSTSLELGLDIGSIDLVVMLATPKGVAKALQRTGRAGHSIHEVSRGLLFATNIGDLVECCATALLARRGHLDALRFPTAPLDVLAQHLMGLGCLGEWRRTDAFELIRRAWIYRDLGRADFDAVLDFLAGGGESLRRQYAELFGKIHLTDDTFEARAGAPRRDYLQNIGTIASDGVVRVLLRHTQLGTVEEGFLRQLRPGDVFTLGGRALRLTRVGPMECWVERADGAVPTVPRWGANKFPLANRVAHEIRQFRRELRAKIESRATPATLVRWIAERLDCGANNAAIIHRVHAAQHGVSEIPTDEFLLVEELLEEPRLPDDFRPAAEPVRSKASPSPGRPTPQLHLLMSAGRPPRSRSKAAPPPAPSPVARHYFFHSLIGRAANDALARVIGLRLGRLRGGNAVTTADDYGFVLTVTPGQRLLAEDLPGLFVPDEFARDLDEALSKSALLQYHFRSAAQTGLMVYRNHFGQQKSARKLQWSAEVIFNVLVQHEPTHVMLREARRDAGHTFLDAPRAEAWLSDLNRNARPIRLRPVGRVPPLSFGMYATKIKEALLVEDPRETLERLFHHWWNQLEGQGDGPG